MKLQYIAASATIASLLLTACGEPNFKVEGEIAGGEGKTIVLEKSDFHGQWVPVDSAKVGSSEKFSIKVAAPASPEIFRLAYNDAFIYLPIDSIETVSVKSSVKDFGRDFSLSGTTNAEQMAKFEKELMNLSNPDSTTLANFKRSVYTNYIKDAQGSIVCYYVLTKFFNGEPLYDPADREDAKYYAAVATQFDNYRPNDPHGRMVKQVSLNVMRAHNSAAGKKTVVEANELRVIDIALPDASGKTVELSDVVGKGKKVVVIFSMMNEAQSPAFNRELNNIYNANKGSVEFYQISFDAGQHEWKEAVANLPWINVIDPNGTASSALVDYNVGSLPAVFIYNAAGDLVERPVSLDDLARKL